MAKARRPLSDHQLAERLDSLGQELEPIRACVTALMPTAAFLEEPGDVLVVGPRPDRGPEAFAVELFPGTSSSTLERYESLHQMKIPVVLREFLARLNGCHVLELSIFGIPPSMAQDPPLLSREGRNPYDLGTAIRIWKHGYPHEVAEAVHFGSRDVAWDRRVGYFIRSDGGVSSWSKSPEIGEVARWSSFADWLRIEVPEMQRQSEAFNAEVRRKNAEVERRAPKSPLGKKKT